MAKTFFERNSQRFNQHQFPRRNGGFTAPQLTLHTYECPHTRSLLAAATWLLQRADPGSYHALAGAASPRSVLQLAPWSHETWHSVPTNNWSIGVSMVAYAHQWNSIPRTARDNLVRSAAFASANAAKWLQEAHGREVLIRVMNRSQAMAKASGFVTHATTDPGRRSDPGSAFPMGDFLDEYRSLMRGGSTTPAPPPAPKPDPTPERTWFDMATEADLRRVVRAEIRETGISISGQTRAALDTDSVSLASLARYGGASLFEGRNQHADVRTRLAALTAAVQALSASVDVNPKDVTDAIEKAVAAALADLKVTLTTEGD